MKKYLIITALFLSIGVTLKAQDDPREKFSAGVKAGLNIANVWDSESQDFNADPKAGFAGGVFGSIPIGKVLGFQPEVLLSQKGFRASGTLLGTDYSFARTSTYIDVPLQIQIKPAPFLTIVAGPQYSFLMHQKNVFTVGQSNVVQEFDNENDQIRKNIFGAVGGLDVNISHVVISGRMGFDLLNNNGDGTSTTPRYKNRWIQLTAGVKI